MNYPDICKLQPCQSCEELRIALAAEKSAREKAESAAGEMREALTVLYRNKCATFDLFALEHALSTDCGKGWVHHETAMRQAELIVEKQCRAFGKQWAEDHKGWVSPETHAAIQSKLNAAVEALTSIASGAVDYCECNKSIAACNCASLLARETIDKIKKKA